MEIFYQLFPAARDILVDLIFNKANSKTLNWEGLFSYHLDLKSALIEVVILLQHLIERCLGIS